MKKVAKPPVVRRQEKETEIVTLRLPSEIVKAIDAMSAANGFPSRNALLSVYLTDLCRKGFKIDLQSTLSE